MTGSKFLIDTGSTRFLMDCGMFQGAKNLRLRNWEALPVSPTSLDHIFLTHAHVDHIGMLPVFVREGYPGSAWGTPVTIELAEINLADAAHLQEEDARFANKQGFIRTINWRFPTALPAAWPRSPPASCKACDADRGS